MNERLTRRLAAIVAADIVGYSALMAADEAGTLARLKTVTDEIINPKVREYGGRFVKTTGDGALLEFPSAVDAVLCAVSVQRALTEHEADTEEALRIRYRIGINLGDVIIEGDDVFGDGVNVAARLEALAEPGGIRISEAVFQAVKGKLDLGFADLGPQKVKNIPEPVPTFQVLLDPEDVGKLVKTRRRPVRKLAAALAALVVFVGGVWYALNRADAPTEQELARLFVLPFRAASAEAELYADAATENVLLGFARVKGMTTTPRSIVLGYKGVSPAIQTLAAEHGATHVLDGEISLTGSEVDVKARLRSVGGEALLDDARSAHEEQFFDLFARLKPAITGAMGVTLNAKEKMILQSAPTRNVQAYLSFAEAMDLQATGEWIEVREAMAAAEEAVKLDGSFVDAEVLLARLNHRAWLNSWGIIKPGSVALNVSDQIVSRVLAAQPNNMEAHHLRVETLVLSSRQDEAVTAARAVTFQNPDEPLPRLALAQALLAVSDYDGARAELHLYRDLSPRLNARELNVLAVQFLKLGDLEQAARTVDQISDEVGEWTGLNILKTELYSRTGNAELADTHLSKVFQTFPSASLAWFEPLFMQYRDPKIFEEFANAMRAAGLPDRPFALDRKLATDRLDGADLRRLVARPFRAAKSEDFFGQPFEMSQSPDRERNMSFVWAPDADPRFVWRIDGDQFCAAGKDWSLGLELCYPYFIDRERSTTQETWYMELGAFAPLYFTIEYLD